LDLPVDCSYLCLISVCIASSARLWDVLTLFTSSANSSSFASSTIIDDVIVGSTLTSYASFS